MRIKKLLSILLVLTLFSNFVPISAYCDEGGSEPVGPEIVVTNQGGFYEITDENEISVLESSGWLLRPDGTLIVGGENWYWNWPASKDDIPENIEPLDDESFTNAGLTVKVILGYQFNDNGYIVKRGARYIDENAFKDCKNLKNVVGLEDVYQVGAGAFENCSSLENAAFDNAVYLNSRAFAGCSNLKSVTITQLPETDELSEEGDELLYPEPSEEMTAPYKLLPFAEDTFENTSSELVINVPAEYYEQLKVRMPSYADRFSTGEVQTPAESFLLSVNGVELSSDVLTVQCGGGTASFDPESKTLTLENALLTGSKLLAQTENGQLSELNDERAVIYSGMKELKVVLKGQNIVGEYMEGEKLASMLENEDAYLRADNFIRASGSLIITGSGTVETRLVGPGEKEGEYTVYDRSGKTHIACERSLTFVGVSLEKLECCPYLDRNANGTGTLNITSSTITSSDLKAPDGLRAANAALIDTEVETRNGESTIKNSTLDDVRLYNMTSVMAVNVRDDIVLDNVTLKSTGISVDGSVTATDITSTYSSEDELKDTYGARISRSALADINRISGDTVTLSGENDLRYISVVMGSSEGELSAAGTRLEDSELYSTGGITMDSCSFYGTDITSYGMLKMTGCTADALYNEQNSNIYAYGGTALLEDCEITSRKQNSKGERTVALQTGLATETFEYTKFSGVSMWVYYNSDSKVPRPSSLSAEFKNGSVSMDILRLEKDVRLTIDNSTFELNNSVLTDDYDYESIKLVGDIDIMIGSWNNTDGIFIDKFDDHYTFDEATGVLTINNDYGYDAWKQIALEWRDGKYRPVTEITDKVTKIVLSDRINPYNDPDFPGYRNLKEIDYGDSVIMAGSLEGCESLEKVTLGKNTEWFPDFSDCPRLKTLVVNSDKIMANAGEALDLEKADVNINIVVPTELENKYKTRIIPQYRNNVNRDGSTTNYPVTVNGEMFTSDKLTIECGDGTATFDPKTNTVTLENATITRSVDVTINGKPTVKNLGKLNSRLDDTTIVLKGTNVIKWGDEFNGYDSCEIDAYGGLTIKGDGTLLLENNVFIYGDGAYQHEKCDAGIWSNGDMKIENTTVKGIYPESKKSMFSDYDEVSVSQYAHIYEISDIAGPRVRPDYKITVTGSDLENVSIRPEYDDTNVSNSTLNGKYYAGDGSPSDRPTDPDKLIYGDVDKDGSITASDALMILRQSVGLSDFDSELMKLGDVDGDSSITANDALSVLRKSAGIDEGRVGSPIE